MKLKDIVIPIINNLVLVALFYYFFGYKWAVVLAVISIASIVFPVGLHLLLRWINPAFEVYHFASKDNLTNIMKNGFEPPKNEHHLAMSGIPSIVLGQNREDNVSFGVNFRLGGWKDMKEYCSEYRIDACIIGSIRYRELRKLIPSTPFISSIGGRVEEIWPTSVEMTVNRSTVNKLIADGRFQLCPLGELSKDNHGLYILANVLGMFYGLHATKKDRSEAFKFVLKGGLKGKK